MNDEASKFDPAQMMTLTEVCEQLRCSRTMIWRRRATGDFPQTYHPLGPDSPRWFRTDIIAFQKRQTELGTTDSDLLDHRTSEDGRLLVCGELREHIIPEGIRPDGSIRVDISDGADPNYAYFVSVPTINVILSLAYMWCHPDDWDKFKASLSEARRQDLVDFEADKALRDIAALLTPERPNSENPA